MLEYYKEKLKENNEIYLRIKVYPNTSQTKIKDILEDKTIKINISSPAKRGKANKELIKYLQNIFKVDKNKINIISGVNSRIKLVKICL